MTNLISLAMLLLIVPPQNQKLPDEFYELPETLRAQATLIVTGTYFRVRSPCIFMPDGTRRWALESRFNVTKVYRGKVGGRSIAVNDTMLPKGRYVSVRLEEGRKYLLLLRPSQKSMKAIAKGDWVAVWKALHDEEIISIVQLR